MSVSGVTLRRPLRFDRNGKPPYRSFPEGLSVAFEMGTVLPLSLFTVGLLGFVLNRRNLILMLVAIEILLLAVTLLLLEGGLRFDDGMGQLFGIVIVVVAGAESVVGLSILVAYYRLRGSLSLAP